MAKLFTMKTVSVFLICWLTIALRGAVQGTTTVASTDSTTAANGCCTDSTTAADSTTTARTAAAVAADSTTAAASSSSVTDTTTPMAPTTQQTFNGGLPDSNPASLGTPTDRLPTITTQPTTTTTSTTTTPTPTTQPPTTQPPTTQPPTTTPPNVVFFPTTTPPATTTTTTTPPPTTRGPVPPTINRSQPGGGASGMNPMFELLLAQEAGIPSQIWLNHGQNFLRQPQPSPNGVLSNLNLPRWMLLQLAANGDLPEGLVYSYLLSNLHGQSVNTQSQPQPQPQPQPQAHPYSNINPLFLLGLD